MPSEIAESPPQAKPAARAAAFFRHPAAAVVLGIVLPLMCLAFDPVVFRAGFGEPILGAYKIAGYALMALSILALAAWLSMRRLPSIFCGFLLAGCVFALVLGIVMLPTTLPGLLFVIGILGFAPFLTAATFWYCAMDARDAAGDRFEPGLAACAFLILVALPICAQAQVSHVTEHSVEMLIDGQDQSAERATRRLEMLGPLFDADVLVWRYDETDSEPARERLASAYTRLTGGDIQDRLRILLD